MLDVSMIRNWILVGGTSFLVIGSMLIFSKWVATKSVPVISPLAAGVVSFWKLGE